MSTYPLPSLHDVDEAALLIEDKIIQTPIVTSLHLNSIATANARKFGSTCEVELFFKCENLQATGSFKYRGASHFLAKLSTHELAKGVVAYSTGNHAQALVHAARTASHALPIPIPTHLVLPSSCSPAKLTAVKSSNAHIYLADPTPSALVALVTKIQTSTRATLVPPSDHPVIVTGAATALRELTQQVASLDAVLVPSGGGGLLVGAIAVCKSQSISVFAAEPETGGPGLVGALRTGIRCGEVKGQPSVADGLRVVTGPRNWEHIKRKGNVDGVFAVSEEQIIRAMGIVVEELGEVVEPSAAVGVAVVLYSEGFARRVTGMGGRVRVGVVLTGGNVRVGSIGDGAWVGSGRGGTVMR